MERKNKVHRKEEEEEEEGEKKKIGQHKKSNVYIYKLKKLKKR